MKNKKNSVQFNIAFEFDFYDHSLMPYSTQNALFQK